MSMKINGYRSETGLIQTYEMILADVKPAWKNLAKSLLNKAIANELAELFDEISLGRQNVDELQNGNDVFSHVYDNAEKSLKDSRINGNLNITYDFKTEVYLYPSGNETLIVPSISNPEMLDIFTGSEVIKQYGYWDHTDKPDDVSEEEWKARYEHWKEVLGPTWTLSDRGLRLSIFDGDMLMNIEPSMVWDLIPSIEERTKKMAQRQYVNDSYEKGDPFSKIMAAMENYTSSPDIQKKYQEKIQGAIVHLNAKSLVGNRVKP